MEKEKVFNGEQPEYVSDNIEKGIKLNPVPKSKPEIGIDLSNDTLMNIADAGKTSRLDLSEIQSFSNVAHSREQIYELLDTMAEDVTIAAALETYAEDATEPNDYGHIVWCESDKDDVSRYVNYLLDSLNVDKNIYDWAYSLCKYGDVYLRFYKQSEFEDDLYKSIDDEEKKELDTFNKKNTSLNEDILIKAYKPSDKYVHYLEKVDNPAEVFELTKFGKSYLYIQADLGVQQTKQDSLTTQNFRYAFKKSDVSIYSPMMFVHGCLQDNSNRVPEQVDIFTDNDLESNHKLSYKVKRGQSILYNLFKIWREQMLLENAMILNRLTKSSLVRVIDVEVGDMPKESVGPYLMNIKRMFEQKLSLDNNNSIAEYTNPGPMENIIYNPTNQGHGNLNMQEIGGDANVTGLDDIDYFQNKLFAGLKIPKQYLGCLRGNTQILLLNGSKVTVEEMFNNRDKYIGKGIMACDKDGNLVPTTISNVMLTKPSTGFYRIHLDNGEYVDVTYDHRMMLRDGSYILAEDLSIGDSLMPYYDYVKDGRRYVLDNNSGKFKKQYRVVAESIYDIPDGYQVHHKNSIKIDDDFDNLIPLTVEEHCLEHVDMLHKRNKEALEERRNNGEHSKQYGSKVINNGIRQMWIKDGDELPVGYSYGTLPFTDEHKKNISIGLSGKPKTYNAYANFGTGYRDKINKVKQERKELGLYDEQYRAKSEELKQRAIDGTGWFSEESKQKRLSRFPENRIKKDHYVRCLCCGNIEKIKCNDDWYNDYLSEKVFWFCSKECSRLNGGGKLARSYQLYLSADCDEVEYEYLRNNDECRPDTYYKYDTLKDVLGYIDNYVPNCNHQVVDIEYIDVDEPAYDISVAADCHTFALPCGIFVHNCTDDAAGFNGGTSLTLISSRYAKTIKKIQNVLIQMITDAINIFLIDKGQENYINNFTIHMQEPTTQEQKDRYEAQANSIQQTGDIMNLIQMVVEDPKANLEILKTLISNVITDDSIIEIIQEQIDKMEEETTPDEMSDDLSGEFSGHGGGDFGGNDFAGDIGGDFDTDMDMGTEESPEDVGETLPTPEEAGGGIDFTDNTEF